MYKAGRGNVIDVVRSGRSRARLTLLAAEAQRRRPASILVVHLTVAAVRLPTLEIFH